MPLIHHPLLHTPWYAAGMLMAKLLQLQKAPPSRGVPWYVLGLELGLGAP